jgi:uncharacterized protein
LEAYRVNIQGLSSKIHHFEFELGDAFLGSYEASLVSQGNLNAKVSLDKRETFIEAEFRIAGTVALTCDRSLDKFDHPVNVRREMIFKFGHEDAEISEEILMIQYNTEQLDLGQLMAEFIGLSIPMKRLHPRFEQADSQDEIVYSSDKEDKKKESDPRWDILKKLK